MGMEFRREFSVVYPNRIRMAALVDSIPGDPKNLPDSHALEPAMSLVHKVRSAWEDRFQRPTVEQILAEIPKPASALAAAIRDAFVKDGAMVERLTWHGVPWRWAFDYSTPGGEPSAYLIPSPHRLIVAVPVPVDLLATLSPKKIAKPIRDIVMLAPVVGTSRWAQWDLTARQQIEDLSSFVTLIRNSAVAAA